MALLEVKDLSVTFESGGAVTAAVSGVSLTVHHGETICLVGESGSGKSMTALSIMGLLPESARLAGSIRFDGECVARDLALHHGHVHCGRGMSMIFQEPMAALNPSMRVEELVGEAWQMRFGSSRAAAREQVVGGLRQAGIADPESILASYPWQLSGGLAQRVVIASALVLQPVLLIADEPTTALDVTTQSRILRVLLRLREERGLAMMFITHDLSIAAVVGGTTLVMNRGEVVEQGPTEQLLSAPRHPYTRSLVSCTPGYALKEGRKRLTPLGGTR